MCGLLRYEAGRFAIERGGFMLQIKNLSIIHNKDLKTLIDDFSFVLNPGDKAVIIGEEGNGKSTLLKWIYDPEIVEDYSDCSGERIIHNERLGYLPQELSDADKDKTVCEFFMESNLFSEKSPKDLNRLAAQLSLDADIYYSGQVMASLSGGEKIKVQLLRLLLDEPTALLLDEPSNDIDLKTLEWLEDFINSFPGIVLFISHDEVLIERTANVVIHIEQVRRKTVSRCTVKRTTFAEYVSMRNANLRNQEIIALNQRREAKIQEEKFRRIYQKIESAQNNVSRQDPHSGRLLKKKMHAAKSLEHRYEREKEEMAEIPDLEEAMYIRFGGSSAIPAGKTVLDLSIDQLMCPDGTRVLATDINLFIRGSEKVCIIGENGTGKSTLIKVIADMLLSRADLRAMYMPQNYSDIIDDRLTPVDYLSVTFDKEEQTRIRTYLGSMKYTADEMDHRIAELSGGQKAKLILLKLSMSDANVLILDEPTRNLSPLSGPVVRQALRNFPGAIISVSHDRKFMSEVCGTIYELTSNGLKKQKEE